jgi:hypothetical protein
MADRGPSVPPAACPRCSQPVTDKMPRVLTADAAYHHRCYLRVLQQHGDAAPSPTAPRRVTSTAPATSDRLLRLLERLAQIVFVVILIGTGLILLEHALP